MILRVKKVSNIIISQPDRNNSRVLESLPLPKYTISLLTDSYVEPDKMLIMTEGEVEILISPLKPHLFKLPVKPQF